MAGHPRWVRRFLSEDDFAAITARHWHDVRDRMVERLRGGAPREAIVAAIEAIGAELAAHYPRV